MKDESQYDISDIHGQSIFNYRHPHIRDGLETELVLRAFQRDFEVNGPNEPPTFYERNEAAQRSASLDGPPAVLCRPVTCRATLLPIVDAGAGLPELLARGRSST